MATGKVTIVDRSGNVVATGDVSLEGDHFGGTIDLRTTPPALRALFDDFEECVNGQMFSFLDDIEDKIRGFGLKAIFDSGQEVRVDHVQVFPSTGAVSFERLELERQP
jgi:hypothetical protein